jgi:hypothetical protein
MLRCGLSMHLRERCLNCLPPTSLCTALGVPASDHSPDDRGSERDNTRDDGPRRITHHAILACTEYDHNALPDTLGRLLLSKRDDAISLDP